MSFLNKANIAFIAFAILCTSLAAITAYKDNKYVDEVTSHLGEEVILGRDTLIIVSYSGNTYGMSKGPALSFELVKKLKRVEK